MHEASLALELVQLASEQAARHGSARVLAVGLRVGALSSVVPEALAFAFPTCAAGTVLEGARLEIERVPAVARCPEHGAVRLELARGLRCPQCGLPTPDVLSGEELELDTLELA